MKILQLPMNSNLKARSGEVLDPGTELKNKSALCNLASWLERSSQSRIKYPSLYEFCLTGTEQSK